MNKQHNISIYVQSLIALLIIQVLHKIVREIPHAWTLAGPGKFITTAFMLFMLIEIFLLLFRIKWSLIIGIICSLWMFIQPVIVRLIMKVPFSDGIWWYCAFPIIQALLIIYFSIMTWKKDVSFA